MKAAGWLTSHSLAIMVEIGEAPIEVDTSGRSKYKQMLRVPAVHYLAVWTILYTGVEVTLGGTPSSMF